MHYEPTEVDPATAKKQGFEWQLVKPASHQNIKLILEQLNLHPSQTKKRQTSNSSRYWSKEQVSSLFWLIISYYKSSTIKIKSKI